MRVLTSLILLLMFAGAAFPVPPPSSPAAPSVTSARFHKHKWKKQKVKDKWVPPKKKKVQIGTDAKGKPIYREIVVQEGYWKYKYVSVCKTCGKKKK